MEIRGFGMVRGYTNIGGGTPKMLNAVGNIF